MQHNFQQKPLAVCFNPDFELCVFHINCFSTIMRVSEGDSLLYGYSFLLGWVTFLFSLAASFTFLAASRKRKLLDNDNVNFTHQKLDISIPQN